MAGPLPPPLRIEYQRGDGSDADEVLTVQDVPRLVAALDGGAIALKADAVALIVSGEAPRCMVSYVELVEDEYRDVWDLVGDSAGSGEVELTFGGQTAEWPTRLIVGVDDAISACRAFAETLRRPQGQWAAQSSSDWPGV